MFSRFFIDRPIFAAVISMFLVLAGLAAMRTLPVAQYPEIAPPVVTVQAIYPGASAETLEQTVASPIENAINGVPNMIYMSSTSSSNGVVQIQVTFEIGTNVDDAAVNVNNRVKQVEPRLPEDVRRQGVTVERGSSSFLQVIAFYSPDDKFDDLFISNYVTLNVLDAKVAGFIAESIQGVGGFVEFPQGYLKQTYEYVRAAGGVCIADEVQTGFGRTGTHFWGFETQDVIPDIVTMAKGIGNGCPLAAVVTTPKIAASMMGKIHFNTFGGNPVVSAMGKAVLEVIEKENLQANSLKLGNHILAGLNKLKEKHKIIGDVRGKGLMLGIEMVKDRATKAPASAECTAVLEHARDMGLLIGKGGLWGQTIRFAPPMCITQADADFLLEVLDASFAKV